MWWWRVVLLFLARGEGVPASGRVPVKDESSSDGGGFRRALDRLILLLLEYRGVLGAAIGA